MRKRICVVLTRFSPSQDTQSICAPNFSDKLIPFTNGHYSSGRVEHSTANDSTECLINDQTNQFTLQPCTILMQFDALSIATKICISDARKQTHHTHEWDAVDRNWHGMQNVRVVHSYDLMLANDHRVRDLVALHTRITLKRRCELKRNVIRPIIQYSCFKDD